MVGIVATPKESSAVPAFARQMNLPCYGCHFQHVPKLNAFGRSFKAGGYKDTATALIEDDGLSLPANLPMAVVLKWRYTMTTEKTASTPDKKGTERGEWQLPDEFALFAAGRAGSNIGYLFEGADAGSGKIIFSGDFGDLKAGFVAYHTGGGSPFFSFEPFNTGVKPAGRAFENRSATSASIASGVTDENAATGLSFYIENHMFFAAAGLWGPANGGPDTGLDLSMVYRLAVTPNVGGFDGMVGVYGVTGKTKCVNCGSVGANATGSLQEFTTEGMGVDTQWQGDLGGLTLEVQAQYATVSDSKSIFGKSDSISALAELGFTKHAGVGLAYLNKDDKSSSKTVSTTATTVALWINLAQNIQLRPEYTSYSGDGRPMDSLARVLMFAGF